MCSLREAEGSELHVFAMLGLIQVQLGLIAGFLLQLPKMWVLSLKKIS